MHPAVATQTVFSHETRHMHEPSPSETFDATQSTQSKRTKQPQIPLEFCAWSKPEPGPAPVSDAGQKSPPSFHRRYQRFNDTSDAVPINWREVSDPTERLRLRDRANHRNYTIRRREARNRASEGDAVDVEDAAGATSAALPPGGE